MGEVFLCKDIRIGRDVAKKVLLSAHRHDPTLQARFLREARIQGQLEHPSIVPVYDLGVDDDGATYFTMKCLKGSMTLKQVLRGLREADPEITRKYSQRKLLTAFSSVCLTVDFAHTRGVLHRDLKPSNVMLGNYREVYVLDRGISKLKRGGRRRGGRRPEGRRGREPHRPGRHGAAAPGRALGRCPHGRGQDPRHLRVHGPGAGARRHPPTPRRPERASTAWGPILFGRSPPLEPPPTPRRAGRRCSSPP